MLWSASGFSSRLTQGPAVSVAGRHPTMTGHTDYTTRQVAYDLMTKPGRTRRYHLSPQTAGTIAALLTLREHVIRTDPRRRRQPTDGTQTGHLDQSTATRRRSASICKPCSTTWASARADKQHLVDQDFVCG
jgi:hypothetical protein